MCVFRAYIHTQQSSQYMSHNNQHTINFIRVFTTANARFRLSINKRFNQVPQF